MTLKENESINYHGGAVTASLINAITGLIKGVYAIGQNLGGMVKRLISGKYC